MRTRVFVGTKLGSRKIYALTERGSVQVITHERVPDEILDYLEQYLPGLSEEEKVYLAEFCVHPSGPVPDIDG